MTDIAFIVGRLGKDPQTRNTKKGEVVSFSIAEDIWQGKDKPKVTRWWRVSAWEYQAGAARKLKKGDAVCIKGKTSENTYTRANGETERSNEITAYEIYKKVWGDSPTRSGTEEDVPY